MATVIAFATGEEFRDDVRKKLAPDTLALVFAEPRDRAAA